MKKYLALSLHLLITSFLFAQSLPAYLPANGLVGWWPFNGNANDESGNGNNGTVNGATFSQNRFSNTQGAINFDGINDFLSLPLHPNCNNSSITFSFWINVTDWTNIDGELHATVVEEAGNHTLHCQIGNSISNGIQICFQFNNIAIDKYITNNASEFISNWNQIVLTVENNNVYKIYLNGLDIGPLTTYPYGNSNCLSQRVCGRENNPQGEFFFNGILDDIAIYNRALTQEEITALYTGTPVNGGGGNTSANAVPPGIPYQAVVRNANGQVAANTAVTTRFTMHQTTADGAVEYQETHALTTSAQGLISTVLGQGTAVQNTFATINWANTTKFLQVEVDLGNGYVDLGTQQLMSVPYSIQSQTALKINNSGLPVYANNAAALAGGLTSGQLYRTATGDLKIVY
jgi:hypothetical protein